MKPKSKKKVVNVITMGCSKNLVDSEVMMKQFELNGLAAIHNKGINDARIAIINTCGFINDAKEESVDTILEFAKAKEDGYIDHLYVMGCLSERYKTELQKEISDVDKYFGVNDLQKIIESLGCNFKSDLVGERLLTTPNHYAYLKISEGCDRKCSFCAIPSIRGRHHSKTIEELVIEAMNLAKNGVKELILIAQDLTYYGIDIYKKQKLSELLIKLAEIDGIEWIRLHYAFPSGFPTDVLDVIRNNEKVCKYLDIPFQHISDVVLNNMRRAINKQQTYDLIDLFRNKIPDLTLRTTLMVGHPGEGEKEYKELLEFVEKTRFDRLGVFKYSEEEGTYGAKEFEDSIAEDIKNERADHLMELQNSISYQLNYKKKGRKLKVIIDGKEGNYYVGRSEADSPEVDNEILIETDKKLLKGNFYEVEITSTEDFDLFACI